MKDIIILNICTLQEIASDFSITMKRQCAGQWSIDFLDPNLFKKTPLEIKNGGSLNCF